MAKVKFQTGKSCNKWWENNVILQNVGGGTPSWQNGVQAQYQFDEGSGTVLTDHSGHGYNGTLGNGSGFAPTWTSAGLTFNGAATVQIPTGAVEGVQTVMVWCHPTFALTNPNMTVLGIQNANWGQMLCGFANGDGRPGIYASGYSDPGFASAQPVISATASFCYRLDGTVWVNATQVPRYQIPENTWVPPPVTTGVTAANIGCYLNNIFFPFVGQVYYLMTWSRQLTSGEIAAAHSVVTAVLTGRGVTLAVNTTLSQPLLVGADGDSITRSYDDGQGHVQRCVTSLTGSNYNLINTAVGGQASDQILANAPSELDPVLSGYAGTSVLFVMIGTNDGFTPTSLSNLQAYGAARYAAGWNKVVAVTGLPRGSEPGSFETARQTFNAALRGGINPGVTWDAVSDWGSDPNMGQAGQTNTAYYGDGVHPSALGHTVGAVYDKIALMQVVPTKVAIVYDTFTGANSTALSAHTPDINTPGHPWNNFVGAMQIQGNQATGATTSFNDSVINTGVSDCIVQTSGELLIGGNGYNGLILRYTNNASYYRLYMYGTNNVYLDFVNTTLASAAYSFNVGTFYQITAVLKGAVITMYINGQQVLSFTTDGTGQAATSHGLVAYFVAATVNSTYDYFIVA